MKKLIALIATLFATITLTAPPATALPAWRDTASSWTTGAQDSRVVNLHYATHPRFDRVVISIRGQIPSGRAAYARQFFYEGSGKPVPIRGGLGVVLLHSRAHSLSGANIYVGPRLVRPGFPELKAIAFTGDFEGQVSFAFGLADHASYRVFFLHDPQRIVIDFKH